MSSADYAFVLSTDDPVFARMLLLRREKAELKRKRYSLSCLQRS
jgi:hypothetical protein